jgi:hypothetical protein
MVIVCLASTSGTSGSQVYAKDKVSNKQAIRYLVPTYIGNSKSPIAFVPCDRLVPRIYVL